MNSYQINKLPLKAPFMSVNEESIGIAAGKLKLCGLKLYLYLLCNKDGVTWKVNPSVYAEWLGLDYSSNGRGVRKAIDEGTEDLIKNGYVLKLEKDLYAFSEQFVPEWLEEGVLEQTVPKKLSSTFGTISSVEEEEKEQFVPK